MTMTTAGNAIPRRDKHRRVSTTTLEIERPHEFAELERRFRIERYVLPDRLRFATGTQASIVFARVHTALHDQLDGAYKSYKYDSLDGANRWAVYALFPRNAEPPAIRLTWEGEDELPHRSVQFAELPFHITVKLLQIHLFHGPDATRFVCNDECYTYARSTKSDYHYCVKVELQGVPTTQESDSVQAFRVIPQATRLGPVDLTKWKPRPWDTLFGKRAVDRRFRFLQLKSDQAAGEDTIYRIVKFADSRARVKYHDPHRLDASRGKILYDFIHTFLEYLQELGIRALPKQRTLTRYTTPTPRTLALDFSRLGMVGVYDNRLARDAHPLAAYVDLFARLRPEVTFVPVEQLTDLPAGAGLLVLLDATAADFAEDGILAGQQDPYQALYRAASAIPKQSLAVNPNDPNALAGGDYLDYGFPVPDHALRLKLEAALNELYLKCAIVHGYEQVPLPLLPNGTIRRAFVRKARHDGASYTTALWFSDGRLHFTDLDDPSAREAFSAMVAEWGVDYLARFEEYCASLRLRNGPPTYDFVVGPDLFVAIDDLDERVLYDYAEMMRRQRERRVLRPIDEFKLAAHYDALKGVGMLPLTDLLDVPIGGHAPSVPSGTHRRSPAWERSQTFFRQICSFDQLLDDIALTHPTISFDELTGGEWMEDISRMFSDSPETPKTRRKWLLARYRRLDRFLGDRGDDVLLTQGIWHDATGAYVVGGVTAMHMDGQDNAHLLRCFRVFQGSAHFAREDYLAAMAVQFVRPRQYTVKPYQFHLIDLYVAMSRHVELSG